MRLIIMWNGRNGSQLLVLSGGYQYRESIKDFLFPTPAENRFFSGKEVVVRKERILGTSW